MYRFESISSLQSYIFSHAFHINWMNLLVNLRSLVQGFLSSRTATGMFHVALCFSTRSCSPSFMKPRCYWRFLLSFYDWWKMVQDFNRIIIFLTLIIFIFISIIRTILIIFVILNTLIKIILINLIFINVCKPVAQMEVIGIVFKDSIKRK